MIFHQVTSYNLQVHQQLQENYRPTSRLTNGWTDEQADGQRRLQKCVPTFCYIQRNLQRWSVGCNHCCYCFLLLLFFVFVVVVVAAVVFVVVVVAVVVVSFIVVVVFGQRPRRGR